jgi:hypothetical protein
MPSVNGRIVLLSVGMSNTTQEFSTFIPISNADPQRNGAVTVVDGAQGGQTAAIISNPNANFWTVIANRLAQAGVTANQVQVIWLKEANSGPTGGFPAATLSLRDDLRNVCQVLKAKYPNVQLCYLTSRIYAGYATGVLNPEPYAYESGFAVKWLIDEQITGSPALNADPNAGPVLSPWIAWGPYLWADGLTPRSDGLTWSCNEFQADGVHPGPLARQKVANALDAFFRTDPTTTLWYLGGSPPLPNASIQPYGIGCNAPGSPLIILGLGLPTLGNPMFRVGIDGGLPGEIATLFLSTQPAMAPLGGSCFAFIDLSPGNLLLPVPGDPSTFVLNGMGRAIRPFAIPSDPAWAGVKVYAQWLVTDPQGALLGLYSLSRGMEIRIGI